MLLYQLLEKTRYIRLNTAFSASLSTIRKKHITLDLIRHLVLIYQLLEKTPYIRLNTALSASLLIIRKTPYVRLNTALSA